MQRVNLEVQQRVKKTPVQMRRDGFVPGVIYGHGDSVSVSVGAKELNKAIHTKAGLNALFNVTLGKDTALAIIKEVQRNIFTQAPTHVDFLRINIKEKLEVNVPIHAVGEASGVKNFGGILEHIVREIRVKCLPDDIPASIDIDVTNLNIGQSVRMSDVAAPKGVEFLTSQEQILLNVVAPKVEEAPKPAEGAVAAAEPEVITKGKKDEEGAPASAAGAAPAGKAAAPAAGKAAAPAKEEKKK